MKRKKIESEQNVKTRNKHDQPKLCTICDHEQMNMFIRCLMPDSVRVCGDPFVVYYDAHAVGSARRPAVTTNLFEWIQFERKIIQNILLTLYHIYAIYIHSIH